LLNSFFRVGLVEEEEEEEEVRNNKHDGVASERLVARQRREAREREFCVCFGPIARLLVLEIVVVVVVVGSSSSNLAT
jgi:hypothetical protein